jgi:sugar phosphate isomerase/epimerase
MTHDARAIPLSLSYYTVPELAPPAMVRAAAQAGFAMVGLRLLNGQPGRDPAPLMEDASVERETIAAMRDTGVRALDASGARLVPATDVDAFGPFLETAARMGARHVLATVDDPERARAIDRLGRVCERAAALDLTVDVEFVPWMVVGNLATAAALVRDVGHPALGIAVDALHFDRSRSSTSELAALPRSWFRYVQLCDAPREFAPDREALLHAAVRERMFPGEGAIDLVGLMRALPRGLPVALEIPMTARAREMPAPQRLARAVQATRSVLDAAYASC